jgi:hypothetical protein
LRTLTNLPEEQSSLLTVSPRDEKAALGLPSTGSATVFKESNNEKIFPGGRNFK